MNRCPYCRRFAVAARYLLLEQSRNRLAVGLLLIFVPIWYLTVASIVNHDPVAFRLRAGGGTLTVDGHNLSLLTAGLNTITEIAGFTIFAATRGGLAFDRRLVLCGFPRSAAMLAKVAAITALALLVALYATAVLLGFWHGAVLPAVLLGYLCAALAYGALGLLLGVLVRNELAGFFVIIMLSLIDTFLQNPIGNPTANKAVVEFFPSYGATQISVAGAFAHGLPWAALGPALLWPLGLALLGFAVFWWRTRSARGPRTDRAAAWPLTT